MELQVRGELAREAIFGQVASNPFYGFSTFKQNDGRDTHDREALGEIGGLVYIDFPQANFPIQSLDVLLQRGF
jgi:hypothetical protein